jgi:hypothetical protein
MSTSGVRFIGQSNHVVATAQVADNSGRFAGPIDLGLMPTDLLHQFEAYEEVVNGQMFSLLDEIEERINASQLKVAFEEGLETPVEDLQIYPRTGRVSFRLTAKTPRHTVVPSSFERT